MLPVPMIRDCARRFGECIFAMATESGVAQRALRFSLMRDERIKIQSVAA